MQYFTLNPTLEILVCMLSCCVSVIAQHKILTYSAIVINKVADGRAQVELCASRNWLHMWSNTFVISPSPIEIGYICGQIRLLKSESN
jgi:hypothetical protein